MSKTSSFYHEKSKNLEKTLIKTVHIKYFSDFLNATSENERCHLKFSVQMHGYISFSLLGEQ